MWGFQEVILRSQKEATMEYTNHHGITIELDNLGEYHKYLSEPKDGDSAICCMDGAAGVFEIQGIKFAMIYSKETNDQFIREQVNQLSRAGFKGNWAVFGIDMKAYQYFKDEKEFKEVFYLRDCPIGIDLVVVEISDFKWGSLDI